MADDIVKEVREALRQSYEADRDNRREMAYDLEFTAGVQWPESVRQAREAASRPVLTVNRLPQFVRQVTNDIRQNVPTIRVIPADGDNAPRMVGEFGGRERKMPLADVYNGLIRQIQYQSSARHVYATAAEQQAICGFGHFRIGTQYVDDSAFDQEIVIQRIQSPLAVYWDPAAIEPDRSDASWCVVTEMMPREAFKKRFPKAAASDVDIPLDSEQGLWWNTRDDVRIAEYWRKVPVTRVLAGLATGETIDLSDFSDADRDVIKRMGSVPMDDGTHVEIVAMRDADGYRVEHVMCSGSEVLSEITRWPGRYLPIVPVIGSEIPLEQGVYRHGLVRMARDSQQLYNTWLTAAAELVSLSPKPKWLVTDKMVENHLTEWHRAHLDPKPFLRYTPDATAPQSRPERQMPPEVPAAFLQMASIAADDMKATIGIYDAGLGARSNETSGKAIMARQREGDVATYHYADNLARSLEYAGRVIVDLIPHIYDNQRVLRIIGEDEAEGRIEINREIYDIDNEPVRVNDLTAGRFDVRVITGPSYTSKRIEAMEALMQVAQAQPQIFPLIGDLIFKNADFPEADKLAERLRMMVPPQALPEDERPPPAPPAPPDPIQQDAMMLDRAERQADVEKIRAEVEKIKADVALKVRELMTPVDPPAQPGDVDRLQ